MGIPMGRLVGRLVGRPVGIPLGRPMGSPMGRSMGRPLRGRCIPKGCDFKSQPFTGTWIVNLMQGDFSARYQHAENSQTQILQRPSCQSMARET